MANVLVPDGGLGALLFQSAVVCAIMRGYVRVDRLRGVERSPRLRLMNFERVILVGRTAFQSLPDASANVIMSIAVIQRDRD